MGDYEDRRKQFSTLQIKVISTGITPISLNGDTLTLEANQNLNLPRNTALELEKEGKVKLFLDPLSDELKQTLSKEKMVGEYQLSIIDDFFYMRMDEFHQRLDRNEADQFNNLLLELFRMRSG